MKRPIRNSHLAGKTAVAKRSFTLSAMGGRNMDGSGPLVYRDTAVSIVGPLSWNTDMVVVELVNGSRGRVLLDWLVVL